MNNKITGFFASWRQFMEKNFTSLTLYLIYFLGIGFSAVLAKIVGKKFLNKSSVNSNWQEINKSQENKINLEKMY